NNNQERRGWRGTTLMDEQRPSSDHPHPTASSVAPRPLRSQVPRSHSPTSHAEPSAPLHARGGRVLRDGTVVPPKSRESAGRLSPPGSPAPQVRRLPAIRLIRRRPPLRLPLPSAHRRLHVLLIVVAMALSLCAGRLLQLQGFDSSSYTIDALTRTLPLLPARGEITDRNGLVLASTQPAVAVT